MDPKRLEQNKWLSGVIYYTYIITPIGKLLLTAKHGKLIGLHIEGQKHFPTLHQNGEYNADIPIFTDTKRQLDAYFTLGKSSFTIDYKLYGTDFQINVWNVLAKIPYGEVLSYKRLTALTAYPNAIRAVASAIGKNPLSIILPCHRVIRSNSSLGGYAGGIAVKKQLLNLES
ncbi:MULTISPECIES: methylated-DNA--[protein]-cysteine S-methyltransferase [Candidatus Cardinium]|uniref:methylated-DNA--[protein]-cysteine S-methyltransferase n=1 Tax=Candidatus Cardinium TaxID=273135 RepID=UPI001FA99B6E|nr:MULTISPECIES: methylated-DNA--[protein]-cysteine S-methyltransferase [Cardinium]